MTRLVSPALPQTTLMVIAIDFGTSNTAIARWNPATAQPELLSLPGLSQTLANNPPLIPSLLYVEDAAQNRVIAGQSVRDRGLDLSRDPRFFRSFKRGIGTAIQGFLPNLEGVTVTFEQIGQWFLHKILDELEKLGEKPEFLVLTVPVDSFEPYRNWLNEACETWAIPKIQLLDEPTAAALGYGTAGTELLLVVDFGGGTVDLSLVQLDLGDRAQKNQGFILKWGDKRLGNNPKQKPKLARVLAKAGENLGGSDIDNWLVDYFAETQKLPKSPLTVRLAERLKIALSSRPSAREAYFNDKTLESYQLALERTQLTEILQQHQFFERLDDLMMRVLQQGRRNGIETSDIDAVLLVGGTAQMPAVQTWVRQYFPEAKIRQDRPFTAIASGALQLAQGFTLKDFLYHGYGIRYWNRRENRHSWHPLIESGQPYPMSEPVELTLGASLDRQPSIELVIGELGSETTKTEVFFDGDRLVTRTLAADATVVQPLNDREGARTIANLNPPGFPGQDRIKLQFWVDEQRFLRATVEDLLTQERLLNGQKVAQLQ